MKKEKKTFPFLFGMPDFKLMDKGNTHVLLFIINSTDVAIKWTQCSAHQFRQQHNTTELTTHLKK